MRWVTSGCVKYFFCQSLFNKFAMISPDNPKAMKLFVFYLPLKSNSGKGYWHDLINCAVCNMYQDKSISFIPLPDLCVCIHVYVCVHACVRACVCVHAYVCVLKHKFAFVIASKSEQVNVYSLQLMPSRSIHFCTQDWISSAVIKTSVESMPILTNKSNCQVCLLVLLIAVI